MQWHLRTVVATFSRQLFDTQSLEQEIKERERKLAQKKASSGKK
jgi:hypothetical protein